MAGLGIVAVGDVRAVSANGKGIYSVELWLYLDEEQCGSLIPPL